MFIPIFEKKRRHLDPQSLREVVAKGTSQLVFRPLRIQNAAEMEREGGNWKQLESPHLMLSDGKRSNGFTSGQTFAGDLYTLAPLCAGAESLLMGSMQTLQMALSSTIAATEKCSGSPIGFCIKG